MKRCILVLLCCAMVFCTAACGGKTADERDREIITPADEITEKVEYKSELMEVAVSEVTKQKYTDGYEKLLATVTYPVVGLSDKTRAEYPKLAKAIDDFNDSEKMNAMNSYADNIDIAMDVYNEDSDALHSAYVSTTTVGVKRADASVLTLLCSNYWYTGGVHGYYGYAGKTFDARTGKELALSDVVNDIDALPDLIREQLDLYWPDEEYINKDAVDEIVDDPESVPWSLDYNGLTLYYNPYHLTAYVSGAQFVTIPFEDNPDLFKEEYVSHPYEYGFRIYGTVVSEDVDGDGVRDKMAVYAYDNEYEYKDNLMIEINGQISEHEIYAYDVKPTFIRTKSGCYLYVECTSENDYRTVYCYSLGTRVREVGKFDGGVRTYISDEGNICMKEVITDPNCFRMSKRTDVLSTVNGWATYSVGASGMPETDDVKFVFNEDNRFELTLLCDLKADQYDEKTETIVGEITLKKGEKVKYFASDDEDTAYLMMNDGTVVKVVLDKKDGWPRTINGIVIDDIFENMMFAG